MGYGPPNVSPDFPNSVMTTNDYTVNVPDPALSNFSGLGIQLDQQHSSLSNSRHYRGSPHPSNQYEEPSALHGSTHGPSMAGTVPNAPSDILPPCPSPPHLSKSERQILKFLHQLCLRHACDLVFTISPPKTLFSEWVWTLRRTGGTWSGETTRSFDFAMTYIGAKRDGAGGMLLKALEGSFWELVKDDMDERRLSEQEMAVRNLFRNPEKAAPSERISTRPNVRERQDADHQGGAAPGASSMSLQNTDILSRSTDRTGSRLKSDTSGLHLSTRSRRSARSPPLPEDEAALTGEELEISLQVRSFCVRYAKGLGLKKEDTGFWHFRRTVYGSRDGRMTSGYDLMKSDLRKRDDSGDRIVREVAKSAILDLCMNSKAYGIDADRKTDLQRLFTPVLGPSVGARTGDTSNCLPPPGGVEIQGWANDEMEPQYFQDPQPSRPILAGPGRREKPSGDGGGSGPETKRESSPPQTRRRKRAQSRSPKGAHFDDIPRALLAESPHHGRPNTRSRALKGKKSRP